MRRSTTIILALLAVSCLAWVEQVTVTDAWNQKVSRTMRDGTAGSALNLTDDVDGSTACAAAFTDMSGSTDATSSLTCANTGEIIVVKYDQASVIIDYTYDSGTVVNMQCDTSDDSATTWQLITRQDSTSAASVRTWTWAMTASGNVKANFPINAELLRCRAWVTGGAAADTVHFGVVLAK